MLVDTDCEEGYHCFNTSVIIIESFTLDINHNHNQLHFKTNLVSKSGCNLESFSITVNFTTTFLLSTSCKSKKGNSISYVQLVFKWHEAK